jgi:hypothetical protein
MHKAVAPKSNTDGMAKKKYIQIGVVVVVALSVVATEDALPVSLEPERSASRSVGGCCLLLSAVVGSSWIPFVVFEGEEEERGGCSYPGNGMRRTITKACMKSPNIIPTNIPSVWKMGLLKGSTSPVIPIPCIRIMVLEQMLHAVPATIAATKITSSFIPHFLAALEPLEEEGSPPMM